jgi:hypothetical protein
MSRRAERERVITSLNTAARFDVVGDGPIQTFDKRSPCAIVLSAGSEYTDLSRGFGGDVATHRILVTVYIRCDAGTEAAAEDALDDLVQDTITDLRAVGFRVPGTNARPQNSAVRVIDGTLYRVEQIEVATEEYD